MGLEGMCHSAPIGGMSRFVPIVVPIGERSLCEVTLVSCPHWPVIMLPLGSFIQSRQGLVVRPVPCEVATCHGQRPGEYTDMVAARARLDRIGPESWG